MTEPSSAILCRIAHIAREISLSADVLKFELLGRKPKVSNSDQLFFLGGAIIKVETSTSSLSFRSSELSQPI